MSDFIKSIGFLLLILFFSDKVFASTNEIGKTKEFSIPTTKGMFELQKQSGKVTFLFFGFIRCPSVCPTTLSRLNEMIKKLSPQEKNKVQVLFVSIDHERDSLAELQKHLSGFSPQFIGATDSKDNLEKITKMFGARFSSKKNATTKHTVIDHTSQVFVINQKLDLVETIKFYAPPDDFLRAFKTAKDKKNIVEEMLRQRKMSLNAEDTVCPLHKNTCSVPLKNGGKILLDLLPHPVTVESDVELLATLSGSDVIPVAIDVEGLQIDMGVIQAPMEKFAGEAGKYRARFYLPYCEIRKMRWKVRVSLKDSSGQLSNVIVYFET